ncbi:GRIP1-associated protein 1-like [Oscarella lobularis]|uniref:GRIP1-associated protein 1-like n=1 Tax=Oscarella lobularis TaxID=121494 RepID=UPI0033139D5A
MTHAALSEDEFGRLQNQLIELKTANYGHEEQARRTSAELASLRQKVGHLEKDLEKANKIIGKSKKAKDVAAIVEESEGLQRKLHHLEEEYQLQNKTLMEELSRLSQENESLRGKCSKETTESKGDDDKEKDSSASAGLEGEVQWLKAVNKTLEKTLQSTKEKYESQIADLKKSFGLRGRPSPLIARHAAKTSAEADGVAMSGLVASPSDEEVKDVADEGKTEEEEATTATYQEEIDLLTQENESLKKQVEEKDDLQLKLDTLEEERRLSQANHEKNDKQINSLQAEITKLNEKLRKKQEILLQVQDEKEKLYSESKTSLSDAVAAKEREIQVLIEQAAKVQGELDKTNQSYQDMHQRSQSAIRELQSSLAAAQSQARGNTEESAKLITELRQKNDGLSLEVASAKEELQKAKSSGNDAHTKSSQLRKNIEDQERKNALLLQENHKLQAQLQELERIRKQLADERDNVKEERQQALDQLSDALVLAEKRKVIADEASRQRDTIVAENQQKLDNMKREHEEALRELRNNVEKERSKSEGLASRVKKMEASEKEAAEVRARIGEMELEIEKLQNDVDQARKDGEDGVEKARQEAEDVRHELESIRQEKEEAEEKFSAQEQALADKDVERKLAEKKSAALIKDLKRQLQLERKRSEKMKEQVSETKGKQSLDELFVPPSSTSDSHRPPSRESSASSATGGLTHPSSGSLPDETTDLLSRLAEMREENWRLEEKVAHLETNASSLAEDVLQKSAIIQQHYMDSKSRVSDWAHSPKQQRSASQRMLSSLMSPFKAAKGGGLHDQQNLKEAVFKLQRVVEETLMKNIHLHQNIDMLVGEVAKLQEENNKLLAGLGSSDSKN